MTRDLSLRLPSGANVDEYPYAKVTADAWATVAAATWSGTVDPADPARTLLPIDPCPRCEHEVSQPVVLAVDLAPSVKNLGFADLSEGETTVSCHCGRGHSGRPDGETGCGTFWPLRFQWSRIAARPAPVHLAAGRPLPLLTFYSSQSSMNSTRARSTGCERPQTNGKPVLRRCSV